MYKIGIIGHSPEHFSAPQEVRRSISNVIDVLSFQYEDEVVFNIEGDIGVGLWALSECLQKEHWYHLFLPYSLEDTCEHWYKDQKHALDLYYENAHSLTICSPDTNWHNSAQEYIVDGSNFIICFWNGKKQGKTYNSIVHAMNTNKMVLDGLNDLKMITKNMK